MFFLFSLFFAFAAHLAYSFTGIEALKSGSWPSIYMFFIIGVSVAASLVSAGFAIAEWYRWREYEEHFSNSNCGKNHLQRNLGKVGSSKSGFDRAMLIFLVLLLVAAAL